MTSRLNYWEEPDLKFGKFSVYPYCKKMRKHVKKRILRVWLSNYLIRRFGYLWTLDITNYLKKKTTDSAKEKGDKTELRMAFRLQKFIGWEHRAIWLWTYCIFFNLRDEWPLRWFRVIRIASSVSEVRTIASFSIGQSISAQLWGLDLNSAEI